MRNKIFFAAYLLSYNIFCHFFYLLPPSCQKKGSPENDKERDFKGTVIMVVADNLAANELSSFFAIFLLSKGFSVIASLKNLSLVKICPFHKIEIAISNVSHTYIQSLT